MDQDLKQAILKRLLRETEANAWADDMKFAQKTKPLFEELLQIIEKQGVVLKEIAKESPSLAPYCKQALTETTEALKRLAGQNE